MKPFSIVCFTSLWLTPMMFLGPAAGQTAGHTAGRTAGQMTCQITVRANVMVAGPAWSLADLLESDTCPALRRASARVPLGKAPLAGSARVLRGDYVRTLLQNLAEDAGPDSGGSRTISVPERIPERITVRRAGVRASCADIVREIVRRIPGSFAAPPLAIESAWRSPVEADPGAASPSAMPGEAMSGEMMSSEINCGAAGRIPENTPLEFAPVWDPALRGWEVYARCVQPADCLPFLVRGSSPDFFPSPDSKSSKEPAGSAHRSTIARLAAAASEPRSSGQRSSEPAAPGSAPSIPRVRAGQTVTLLWDQDGIRLVVPAVALDAGAPGARVRARIVRGGAMVPAVVVGAGLLRAAS